MWIDLINDNVGFEKVVKILVGNKSDLPDRKINEEEAKHYAGEYGMKFIRVSSKEGVNINYLFEAVENFIIEKTIAKKNQFAKSKINNLLLTYLNNKIDFNFNNPNNTNIANNIGETSKNNNKMINDNIIIA